MARRPRYADAVRLQRLGRSLCAAVGLIGATALVGWVARLPLLTTVIPDQPPMMPNTALSVTFLGLAGALPLREDASHPQRFLRLVAAALVLAIALATLVEYALDVDLRIDEVIAAGATGAYPGRMSPPTAFGLTLLASALILADRRHAAGAHASQWLVLTAGLVALVALTGMLLGAASLYRLRGAPVTGVAPQTAVALLLLSLGMLLERPKIGLMSVVTARGPGGVLLRRLLLPTLIGPALLAVIVGESFASQRIGDLALGLALVAIATTVAGLAVLTLTARPLNETEAVLRASEAKLSGVISIAADAIIAIDADQRITMFNRGAEKIFGYARREALGASLDILLPERFRAAHREHVAGFANGPSLSRQMDQRGDTQVYGRRKSGEEFPAEAAISRLEVDGERILTVVLRDITERKRVEREQRFLADAGAVLASSLEYEQTVSRIAEWPSAIWRTSARSTSSTTTVLSGG